MTHQFARASGLEARSRANVNWMRNWWSLNQALRHRSQRLRVQLDMFSTECLQTFLLRHCGVLSPIKQLLGLLLLWPASACSAERSLTALRQLKLSPKYCRVQSLNSEGHVHRYPEWRFSNWISAEMCNFPIWIKMSETLHFCDNRVHVQVDKLWYDASFVCVHLFDLFETNFRSFFSTTHFHQTHK